uniref:KH domain-containing protein n=1 Tax=Ascaris lumbricoides TaxID=6252 RepID=A0A0M3HFZ2_ASCLU
MGVLGLCFAEINRVQLELFQFSFSVEKPNLPAPKGQPIVVQEKVYIPTKEHPDYNFVGRILGPRGMTAKQLEVETGCRIMVRGRGSMRDTGREEKNRGKPNWEHLNDELHVLIQCEDTPNRAHLKLKGAVSEIKKLLIPAVHFLLLFALISMLSQQLFSGLKTSYSLMARKHERSTLRWIALLDCGYPVKNFR